MKIETNKKIGKQEREDIKHQTLRKYRHHKKFSKWSVQFYTEMIKRYFRKKYMFLIIMQLRSGKYDMFTTSTSGKHFKKLGGLYYLDSDMIRHDSHSGLDTLFYHQDCAVPFKIDFNIDNLMEKVKEDKEDGDNTIVKALNPTSLRGFIDSQVIEKVLKGQELSKDMKMIKMIVIASCIMSAITLLIIAKTMGYI